MIIFGGIVAGFFTSWVDLYIDNEVILRNGSQSFGWWRKPPVTPTMSIYIYNVTNADAFLNNGEKPVLDELGPYVYRLVALFPPLLHFFNNLWLEKCEAQVFRRTANN